MGNSPSDFQFQTEPGIDGAGSRVSLSQPIPVPFDKLIKNQDLLIRLLSASGLTNIKSIEIKDQMAGTYDGQNRTLQLTFEDEKKPRKIFVKGVLENNDSKLCKHLREAWFYDKIARNLKSGQNNTVGVNTPNIILATYDIQSSRYYCFMDFVESSNTVIDELGDFWYDPNVNFEDAVVRQDQKMNMEMVFYQAADQLAALHSAHWCDHSLLQNAQSMLPAAPFMCGQEKDTFDRCTKDMNDCLWMCQNMKTKYFKKYPLGAQCAVNILRNTTWENFQNCFKASPIFCMIHGDCDFGNMLWSAETNSVTMIDFTYVNMGHPACDLGQLLILMSKKMRTGYQDRFLERYHSTLISSGKVSKDQLSLEQLKIDVINYGVARFACAFLILCIEPIQNESIMDWVLKMQEDFLEEHPEALECKLPMQFICNTFDKKIQEPKY